MYLILTKVLLLVQLNQISLYDYSTTNQWQFIDYKMTDLSHWIMFEIRELFELYPLLKHIGLCLIDKGFFFTLNYYPVSKISHVVIHKLSLAVE